MAASKDMATVTQCVRRCCTSSEIRLDVKKSDVTFASILARGAESTVYQGTFGGKTVAIKKPQLRTTDDMDRFHRELQILCSLRGQPYVTSLLGCRAHPPDYFLIFECYSRGNIHDALYDSDWRPAGQKILEVALQLSEALHVMHSQGLVHRDIKPSNILLGADGCVHLSDFGLAARSEELQHVNEDTWRSTGKPTGGFHKKNMVGTVKYMAPEVLRKVPHSTKSDVFSYAVTINEIATAIPPYSDCTTDAKAHTVLEMDYSEQELIAAISSSDLRPTLFQPSTSDPALSVLRSLLERCWERDPQARPDMSEVVRMLREGVAEGGTQTKHQGEGAAAAEAACARDSQSHTGNSQADWLPGDRSALAHHEDSHGRTGNSTKEGSEARGRPRGSSVQISGGAGTEAHHLSCPSCSEATGSVGDGGLAHSGSAHMDHMRGGSAGEMVVVAESEAGQLFDSNVGDRMAAGDVTGDEGQTLIDLVSGPGSDGAAADVAVSIGAFETAGGRERMEDRHFVFTWGPASGGSQPAVSYSAFSPSYVAVAPPARAGVAAATGGSTVMSEAATAANGSAATPVAAAAPANYAGALSAGGSSSADMFSRLPAGKVHLCGVFDGHRGYEAAEFAARKLPALILSEMLSGRSISESLHASFLSIDHSLRLHLTTSPSSSPSAALPINQQRKAGGYRHPGCTACVAVVAGNMVVVANAGDCRVVMGRRNSPPLQLTTDHVASNESERVRVQVEGGTVEWRVNTWRVGTAGIEVTRSLGDFDLKPGVTARPEVTCHLIQPEDEFLVVASDGLWVSVPNEDAVALVRDTVKEPSMSARRLSTEAASRGSGDNITVAVVFLRPVSTVERVY